jgi:predicted PurR-regulated permease PerM
MSTTRTKRVIAVSASIIVLLAGIYLFANILAILIVSVLITLIFDPLVTFIEKRGFNRGLATLSVFITMGFFIYAGISLVIPKILNQFSDISSAFSQDNINILLLKIESKIEKVIPFISSYNLSSRAGGFIQNYFTNFVSNISEFIYNLISILAIAVIVPFLTFYMLKDKKALFSGILDLMPNKYFEVSYAVLRKITIQLSKFVRSWIFDAAIVGFCIGVGVHFLGIDNSTSIGFIAGIGHLIPYFGPVIGGIPALLIALIQYGDFSMLPSIVILFAVIYTLDNGFIQPKIFSKSTDIHPIVIILLILIGSELLGIFGMLLAVPTATVVKTASREIYIGYKNYKIIKM